MSKLIDLTNNIRLLEFEPPHFASEKYLEAFKTIDLGEYTDSVDCIGQRCRSTVRYKKQRPQTLFRSTCQIGFDDIKALFFLFGSSINGAIENGLVGSVFLNVYIRIEDELPNYKVISKIRCELPKYWIYRHYKKNLQQAGLMICKRSMSAYQMLHVMKHQCVTRRMKSCYGKDSGYIKS